MRHTSNGRCRQLALFLEPESSHPLMKETQQALVQALAELILEAYGADTGEVLPAPGGDDEPKDHA